MIDQIPWSAVMILNNFKVDIYKNYGISSSDENLLQRRNRHSCLQRLEFHCQEKPDLFVQSILALWPTCLVSLSVAGAAASRSAQFLCSPH